MQRPDACFCARKESEEELSVFNWPISWYRQSEWAGSRVFLRTSAKLPASRRLASDAPYSPCNHRVCFVEDGDCIRESVQIASPHQSLHVVCHGFFCLLGSVSQRKEHIRRWYLDNSLFSPSVSSHPTFVLLVLVSPLIIPGLATTHFFRLRLTRHPLPQSRK